ncbi:DUF6441 family protein [Brevundimonas sp.]|uniref:DUF6441 family protein n=1 Tax=Brevundimonas sp. TaxID=1871086 RepID=UPI00289CF39C|nr:DUF6441 family protein [Brevundimonas sp.]
MTPNQAQLRAALRGSVDEEIGKGLKQTEVAIQAALFDFAGTLQDKWRVDVAQSGLRNAVRMAKTVRLRRYPNQGLDPAALVYSSFPLLQRAFEQATTVRSKNGLWLVVPNPEVWPQGRVRRQGGRGARQRESTVGIAERRFGKLRFVYRPNGASWLVADARKSRTRAGTYRYASATAKQRGNVEEVIVFYVVREARLPRMLRGNVIRDRARRDADATIDRLFVKYFERGSAPNLLTGPSND